MSAPHARTNHISLPNDAGIAPIILQKTTKPKAPPKERRQEQLVSQTQERGRFLLRSRRTHFSKCHPPPLRLPAARRPDGGETRRAGRRDGDGGVRAGRPHGRGQSRYVQRHGQPHLRLLLQRLRLSPLASCLPPLPQVLSLSLSLHACQSGGNLDS